MPFFEATSGRRAKVQIPILAAVTAAIVVACFTVPAEASRDDQEETGPEPFSAVGDTIQQNLVQAANKLVESSKAQAALTKTVSENIGQYKGKVKKIAATMGDVLQARQMLTKAYQDDINRGEDSRTSPLQVDIPELSVGDDFELPTNTGFSNESSQDYGTPPSSQQKTSSQLETQQETGLGDSDRLPSSTVQRDAESQNGMERRESSNGPDSHAQRDTESEPSDLDGEGDGLESGPDIGRSSLLGLGEVAERSSQVEASAPEPVGGWSAYDSDNTEDAQDADSDQEFDPAAQESIAPQISSTDDSREDDIMNVQPDSQQPSVPGASSFLSTEEYDEGINEPPEEMPMSRQRRYSLDEDEPPQEMPMPERRYLKHSQTRPLRTSSTRTARPLRTSSLLQSVRYRKAARRQTRSHHEHRQLPHTRSPPRRSMIQKSQQKVTLHDRAGRVQSWAGLAASRFRQEKDAASRHHRSRLQDVNRPRRNGERVLRNGALQRPEEASFGMGPFRDRAHVRPAGRRTNSHTTRLGHHRHGEAAVAMQPRSFTYDDGYE